MKKMFWPALAIAAASLVGAGGASAQLKIGVAGPLTGPNAAFGAQLKNGAEQAAADINAKGGINGQKIELSFGDDVSDPKQGVSVANKFAGDGVKFVVGHFNSGVTMPASEVYQENGTLEITPSATNPRITERGMWNIFRTCGRDDQQGAVAGEYIIKNFKSKKVAIVHDKTTYGQGVAEFFRDDAKKKGLTVAGFDGTEEKSNFDAILTPIKAKNPSLIYFGGIYDQGAPFFKQASEKGIKAKFMGPDGMDSSDLTKIAGKAVVGMNYTSAAGPASALPKAKAFVDDFKKKFSKNPEPYAAEAYDATTIAIKALEDLAKGGKKITREDVSAAIRKVKHSGITGEIAFDGKGDRLKAQYFVLTVASDNPEKWGDNKIVKQLTIAPPAVKK